MDIISTLRCGLTSTTHNMLLPASNPRHRTQHSLPRDMHARSNPTTMGRVRSRGAPRAATAAATAATAPDAFALMALLLLTVVATPSAAVRIAFISDTGAGAYTRSLFSST